MFKHLLLVISILFTTQAFAELNLRVHYGTMNAPKGFNDDGLAATALYPTLPAPKALGADVLYVMPILPLEFGLRYETMSTKNSTSLGEAKVEATRVSALGGYRFLNTLGYLGVLAHVGVSSTAKYTETGGGTSTPYKGKVDASYGLGAEAGVKFLMFTAGAELGYDMFKIKSMADDAGATYQWTAGKDASIDFSGVYMKILVGLTF